MVRATGKARSGFTLTELLVVIFIIITLLGILLPALQVTRIRAQVAQAQNDISQLSTGIGNFKSTYGVDFVPNYFKIKSFYDPNQSTNPATWQEDAAYVGYLRKIWGRLGSNFPTWAQDFAPLMGTQTQLNLGGAQCLVFFLGGYVSNNGQPELGLGFSTSGSRPFFAQGSAGNRGGVFYEFKRDRLHSAPNVTNLQALRIPCQDPDDFPTFWDPWNEPYIYFTSINGNDYSPPTSPTNYLNRTDWVISSMPNGPFFEKNALTLKYINANGFQIISAGPDAYRSNPSVQPKGGIGPGGAWAPGEPPYQTGNVGADDLSNFYPKQLGAP